MSKHVAFLGKNASDEDIQAFVTAVLGSDRRYSPDQPRVPAGSEAGGEFAATTSGIKWAYKSAAGHRADPFTYVYKGMFQQLACSLCGYDLEPMPQGKFRHLTSRDGAAWLEAQGSSTEPRYSPDQPRVPAGNPDGGKWTDGLISPHAMGDTVPAAGAQTILGEDPTVFANLPPEVQAKLLAQLQKHFPGMTQEQLEANIEKQLLLGLADAKNGGAEWYSVAGAQAAALGEQFGLTHEQAVGVVAALSPQQGWGSNVALAQFAAQMVQQNPFINAADVGNELYDAGIDQMRGRGVVDPMVWNGEIRLSDLPSMEAASAIKQYAMAQGVTYVDDITGRTNKITFGAGLPSLETAIDIMRGQSPDAALNGHKVRSFYNNILAQSHSGGSVTIDVHAVSAAVGQAISSQDKRMVVMQSPKTTAYSAKGVYSLFADAYRKVAKDHNLSPEQVQAIVWLQWRANN